MLLHTDMCIRTCITHSETGRSTAVCAYPPLIATCCVLLRYSNLVIHLIAWKSQLHGQHQYCYNSSISTSYSFIIYIKKRIFGQRYTKNKLVYKPIYFFSTHYTSKNIKEYIYISRVLLHYSRYYIGSMKRKGKMLIVDELGEDPDEDYDIERDDIFDEI